MQLNGEAPMAAIPSPRLRWGGLGWGAPMTRTERDRSDRRTKISRRLRREATPFEGRLWLRLKLVDLPQGHFRRQAPIGPYIVDFACLSVKLIVEIDGDTHETDRGLRHDANRDSYLLSLGFSVLRIDEPDVINNPWHVAQAVRRKAESLSGDPTRPLRGHPPLKGEGTQAART